MHKVWFFPVFEFHSRSETLRFKSSQSQLCFVHSSQFSTLEVSGGQIGFFFKYDWFCRRDGWQLFSSMQVWEQLVNQTKRASKDHAALADIYGTHISQRCNNITEDLQRMYKKVRVQSQSCTHWVLDCKLLFFLLVPRDWLWDPWRSAQGAPRIAHRNEDPSQLPVRI